jgi:hypothetical protein
MEDKGAAKLGAVMSVDDLIEYHSSRATEELDRGLTTNGLAAARAHLGLATLHFDRLRSLTVSSGHKLSPPLQM